VISQWTQNLVSPDEKERFKNYLLSVRPIIDRQNEILQQWDDELTNKETSEDQYNSPSWAMLQADRNGYRRALRKVKQLNLLDPKE
jgi:hypothetical protein